MRVQIPRDVLKDYRVVELGRVFLPKQKKFKKKWEVWCRDEKIIATDTKRECLDFVRVHYFWGMNGK